MRGPSVAVFANFTRALARARAPHLAQVVWRLKGALLLFLYDTMPWHQKTSRKQARYMSPFFGQG